jgi:phage gp46-like protein
MVDVLVRSNEACDPDSSLLWDSVWDAAAGQADWALADPDETLNRGGLRAKALLETAVTIALFTDKRIDQTHPLFWLADGDPRGYWGDGIDVRADLFETDLGSHLWLLERAPLTINGLSAAMWAKQFASEALAPLLQQGVVARIDVDADTDELKSRLNLYVNLYGRDGNRIYDRKFDLVWNQVS